MTTMFEKRILYYLALLVYFLTINSFCDLNVCFFNISGMAGFIAAGLIGVYKYRHRGTMSTSVFLMQLRVIAQGTVVASLTTGLAYTMYQEHFGSKATKQE